MTNKSPINNFITERRINIITYINTFFPKDISKLISEYDYYLKGVAHTFLNTGCIDSIAQIATLPGGRIVSRFNYHTITICNLQTGLCDISFSETAQITCMNVLRDGRIVYALLNGIIKIWNPETNTCDIEFPTNEFIIHRIGALADGYIIIASGMNLKLCKLVGSLQQPHAEKHCIDLKIPNLLLLCGELSDSSYRIVVRLKDETVRIYNLQTKTFDVKLETYSISGNVVLYDDDKIIGQSSINEEINIKIWSLRTGECINTIPLNTKYYNWYIDGHKFGVLPDGRIVIGNDNELKILNLRNGKYDVTQIDHIAPIRDIVVLSDGRIVSASSYFIKLWS
jgi:WD40 repeat protein